MHVSRSAEVGCHVYPRATDSAIAPVYGHSAQSAGRAHGQYGLSGVSRPFCLVAAHFAPAYWFQQDGPQPTPGTVLADLSSESAPRVPMQ